LWKGAKVPEAFTNCVKKGGRVRRISGPDAKYGLSKNQWVNVCFIGGQMHRGHVHTKAKENKKK